MTRLAHSRELLSSFAIAPLPTLEAFLASQSSTLSSILTSSRGSTSLPFGHVPSALPEAVKHAVAADGQGWREEMRRKEIWQGAWLGEGVSMYANRRAQGELLNALRTPAGPVNPQ